MAHGDWLPRTGEWVEVRPAAEILATLDAAGDCQRLPFMAEMLPYAGQRFQVSAVAHKTCDTATRTGGRSIPETVHLADLRCDGSAHGGCEAACLLFWKTAWLRPATGPLPGPATVDPAPEAHSRLAPLGVVHSSDPGKTAYRCQATTLPAWSTPLSPYDLRQYVRDVTTGNVTFIEALRTMFLASVARLRQLPYGTRVWLALYGALHRLLRGQPSPFGRGRIRPGQPTPEQRLGLQPGELVRLKSKAEILATVNADNKNRGLSFDPEMAGYCGGEYRVAARVGRIVNESTGEMMHFGNPCIRLEGVVCKGLYSQNRHLCPRRITPYFREIWLKRSSDEP